MNESASIHTRLNFRLARYSKRRRRRLACGTRFVRRPIDVERVWFLVCFLHIQMPELYRAADVFTPCSIKEMMPIILLEAAASGWPCIANRHPVLEWIIGRGGESIELSAALRTMPVCEPPRAQCRNQCIDNFSREAVVDRIPEYYRFLVGKAD